MNSKRYEKHRLNKRTENWGGNIRTEVEISEYILKQFLKEITKSDRKFLHNVMNMVTNGTISVQ